MEKTLLRFNHKKRVMKFSRASSNPAIASAEFTYDLLTLPEPEVVMSGSDNSHESYQERLDFSEEPWLLMRSILLSPIALLRAIVVFSCIFLVALCTTLVLNGKPYSKLSNSVRKFFNRTFILGTRFALFVVGMYWIHYEYVTDDELREMQKMVRGRKHQRSTEYTAGNDQKLDLKYTNDENIDPYLVVCNHMTSFDSFVLKHCFGTITAVAKGDVKNGVLGRVCENLGCIFVEKNNAKKIVEEMYQRTNEYYEYKRNMKPDDVSLPKLIVYPEGTTTSGHQMIRFHLGAFRSGAPIQPIVLRFPYEYFNFGWTTSIAAWKYFLIHWTQLYIPLTVVKFPPYIPNEEERQNPLFYAENVRRIMCCASNIHAGPDEHKMALDPTLFNRYYKQTKSE